MRPSAFTEPWINAPDLMRDNPAGASWPEKNIERLSATGFFAFRDQVAIRSPLQIIDFVDNLYPVVACGRRSRQANAHPDVRM
jgi:hypothetical protein